ncbi:MAG: hypothetical protein KDA05_10240, partial [Phycisphaerales bacterium]|nr:hypothetical protein [Phycisphaerales bacterium]
MRTASAVLAVAMAAGLAHGAEIIGNILAPQVSSTVFGTGSTSIFKAVGFTMGSDAYDVTQVTLAWDTNVGGGGNPVVAIYDGAGAPATELMVFNNPANIATPGIVGDLVFTASAPLTLQPNTTYWVHVRSEPMAGPSFNWLSTSNVNPPTGAGATFVTYNFNGGSSSFYNRFLLEGDLAGGGCDPDLTTGAVPGQPGFGVPNGVLN